MKGICLSILVSVCLCSTHAQSPKAIYQKQDSILVERMLNEADKLENKSARSLYFARQFLGVPYVGATLEIADPETLVLNLRELDCTTFVDVVTALTLCNAHHLTTFSDFMAYLQRLRYDGGVINGYPSRNHYYSSWILNAEKQKLAHEITPADYPNVSPFTGVQTLNINFMSLHTDKYAALVKHPEFVAPIRDTEKKLTGKQVHYIPNKALGNSSYLRKVVHDGDILALVTKRPGLDVSHLGFAVWGKDGNLHLLNASSLHHKVVVESKTLQDYLQAQRLQLGVRVIRITP